MSRVHAWTVEHITYPVWQGRTGGVVLRALPRIEQTQWLSGEALRAIQWSRLRALLAHACCNVPFYRDRLAVTGMTPADIRSLDDLRALPPLEKADLRDGGDALRSGSIRSRLVERKTSGSTGIPVVVWTTAEARDQWDAATFRARRWWDVQPGDRRITLMSRQPMTRSRWFKQRWLANVLEFPAMDLSETVLERICRTLADASPRALAGYPSSLAYVARFIEARGRVRPTALRAVFVTGEVLYPDTRALLRRVFRCPVVNEYGSSETGHIACECPYGRWHIAAENVLVEIDKTPREVDGAGALLLTDLTNFAMPLIRYRIDDLGSLGASCPCGRGLPVLTLLVGRTEDLVVLPDGRRMDASVFGVVVDVLARRGAPLNQYRVTQHAVDHFEVLVAGAVGGDDVSAEVAQRVIDALGSRVTVTVRAVPVIPPEPTGKRRRFVSLVANEAARVTTAR